MATKTCDNCGEHKLIDAFRNADGRAEDTCTKCRDVLRRKAKRKAVQADNQRRRLRVEMQEAQRARRQVLASDTAHQAIKELTTQANIHENKLLRYLQKIRRGDGTTRTEKAVKYQQNYVDYYVALIDIVKRDAAMGRRKPLEYYLSNTYLLNKFGFTCVVVDGDPAEE